MIRIIATFALPIAVAGCAVAPLDSANEPDLVAAVVTQDSGGTGCVPNQTTCYAWSGSTQVQGTCTVSGVCCAGCIDSRGTCQSGSTTGACGQGGSVCADCNDGNECTTDSCNPSGGVCHYVSKTHDSLCDGRTGHCDPHSNTCCSGAFFVDLVTQAEACVAQCPFCMCKSAIDGVCYPSTNIPSACACN